ncbi:MAG: flavin reductase domain protein FMN-binding protein [Deltaproteobacteria bacterium]|nr:flavin reductase domain protein FMN-binding protein [Deltaproteobacteria bacterium]
MRKTLPPTTLLFPTPVVLVTCVNEAGKPNIITLAWVGVVNSDPPMIGISIRPERYSHACVKQSREFVVNLPSAEMVRKVDACGVLSGRETDKFSSMGWKQVTAQKVRPPLIDECPVQMECRVKQEISLGSHDLFLGEIVALHVKEEVQNEKGRIDILKVLPLVFCPGANEYWNLGKSIGHYGFTKGKP